MIRNRNSRPAGPEGKRKKFSHSPFEFEHKDKVSGNCNRDGKITIRQEGADGAYDEVVVSASLIYKLVTLLENTRSFKWVDASEITGSEEHE